jgi:opacity protein-like surface antigen
VVSDRRAQIGRRLGALALALLAASPVHAAVERPHALAFKLGYHVYPTSSYFQLSEEALLGGANEFRGQSLEVLDYTYQWTPRWGLNVSLLNGYYRKYTPLETLQQSILTTYATVTPVYTIWGANRPESWLVYAGAGVGRYGLILRFDDRTGSAEFHDYTLGYHTLIGAEYLLNEQVGFLIEEKYARARVKFGREIERTQIDLGGHNVLVGVRFHF